MIKDPKMDEMIKDIISIFTEIEGVELVRLNGLVKHASKISGFDLNNESLQSILFKLKNANVINWKYIMRCPHCGEVFFQIVDRDINTPKLCDSCNTMFKLTKNDTLIL